MTPETVAYLHAIREQSRALVATIADLRRALAEGSVVLQDGAFAQVAADLGEVGIAGADLLERDLEETARGL